MQEKADELIKTHKLEAQVDEASVYRNLPALGAPEILGVDSSLDAKAREQAATVRSTELLGKFLRRPEKYHEKYSSQELALLFFVWLMVRERGEDAKKMTVLDVGAGNANLSALISIVLDVDVVCVEMESPRDELK